MIAKLEMAQIYKQRNMEQTQNTTMGATTNNESTITEQTPLTDSSLSHWGLKSIYSYQIFDLDSVFVNNNNTQIVRDKENVKLRHGGPSKDKYRAQTDRLALR